MSSSDRLLRAALLALALPLAAGCGFKPVYGSLFQAGQAGPTSELLNQVAIDPIADRSGQVLRNLLIDRFYLDGRPMNPAYRLAIRLSATEEELGIQPDATATRARLRLVANYELIDVASGQPVYRSFSRTIVSYNILEAQYSTLASEQDALERGLSELSEDIRTRLALFFTRDTVTAGGVSGVAAKP